MAEEQDIKPKNSGSKKMFDNPMLEKLSRTHISIPISIYALTGIGLATYSYLYTALPTFLIAILFIGGILTFTLAEYWVHRSVYHIETDTEKKKKFQYTVHGVHHEYPKDKSRLAMPPVISITIVLILLGLFRLLIGVYAFAFLPGFFFGYAGYLFIHYIVHAYQPPKNFFKFFWLHHAQHHYKDGLSAFGVSTPLWDYVFGTMPK